MRGMVTTIALLLAVLTTSNTDNQFNAAAFMLPPIIVSYTNNYYPSPSNLGVVDADTNIDTSFINTIYEMDLSPRDDAIRIFHGRGLCYPGYEHITLDWYPPVLLLTTFKNVTDDDLKVWSDAMAFRWNECFPPSSTTNDDDEQEGIYSHGLNLVYQRRSGTPATTHLVSGRVPERHVVTENGDKYLVHLLRGQNHGLFLDMANGRTWVRENSVKETVLNLFAYTCAFSVSALNGGALEVINVDMARGALKVGQRNHEINGLEAATSGRSRFLGHDIFKSWGKIKRLGPYGIIIVDPPSFQKGSFVAKKDYEKLIRRLPTLLKPEGKTLICLNAPELDTNFLTDLVATAAPELQYVKRLDNPDTFCTVDMESSLKVLLYELPKEAGGRV